MLILIKTILFPLRFARGAFFKKNARILVFLQFDETDT